MKQPMKIAMLASLVALGGPAFAQSVAQPDFLRSDLSAFHGGPHSLVGALEKVQRLSGGQVLEIRFTDAGGMPGWQAVVAKGPQIEYLRLEDRSGQLVAVNEHSRPVWMLNWRGRDDVKLAESATVPLQQAVMTAEQQDDGRPAVAAGIARSASNSLTDVHAYNILMDDEGRARRISVDDATGQVIMDPQALAGWP